jgi:hypothetical protein
MRIVVSAGGCPRRWWAEKVVVEVEVEEVRSGIDNMGSGVEEVWKKLRRSK